MTYGVVEDDEDEDAGDEQIPSLPLGWSGHKAGPLPEDYCGDGEIYIRVQQTATKLSIFGQLNYHSDVFWNVTKEVVYIQIIRSSKSLCMITEAHDVLRNFWIL